MAKRFSGGRSFSELPIPPPPPPPGTRLLIGQASGVGAVTGALAPTPGTHLLAGLASGRGVATGTLIPTLPPRLLIGNASGAGATAGALTTAPPATSKAGVARGVGTVTGALTLTGQPPPVGNAFYINSATGNNANSGAIGAPWLNYAPITPARVPAGSTIFFARGMRHLPAVLGTDNGITIGTLNIPQNNITIDAYGSGTRPVIYGWQDIKGVAADWVQSATPNNWSRLFTIALQSRYRFKVDGVIRTLPLAGPTASTTVDTEGEWSLHQIGSGPFLFPESRLYMYSVGNPATVKTTIEISTHMEWCIRAEARLNFTIKNIEITGWRGALWVNISGLLIEDVSIYGLARRACHTQGSGTGVIRRFEAYQCGHHVVGIQAPGGAHGLFFGGTGMQVTVDGARIWECGEDGIQLGGTLTPTAHILLDGRNWWSHSSKNRENPMDLKGGNVTAIHWTFWSSNEGCITMQGTTRVGHYIDCCLSQPNSIAALYIQEIRTQIIVDRCMIYNQGGEAAFLVYSGGPHKIMASVLIAHSSSVSGLILVTHPDLNLIHTTLAQHSTSSGRGLYIQKRAWPVSVLTITKASGPDGEGNITYNARISDTQIIRNWPEGGFFEFTGLTGASAPLNNFMFQTFGVTTAILFMDNGLFKVPASLGTPDTLDLTGGTLWSIPRLRTFIGNAIIAGDRPLAIDNMKSLPDASYGAAYLKDRVISTERHASTKHDDVTEVFYTAAQVKAASGTGSLIAATGGKIGGPANRTDFAATEGIRWVNVSSIVVTDGVAVVNFATPHGFEGDKVCIKGAVNTGGTPAMLTIQSTALVGCNFFRVNSTTQIEFDALPWVINQTATGTITATDGQLIAGSAGLGTHVQTNAAPHGVTLDFHGKSFPAPGAVGNFGAIAP